MGLQWYGWVGTLPMTGSCNLVSLKKQLRSSVQEVFREPASQAEQGQCVHNAPQTWPLVDGPQWRSWADTEFLGQPRQIPQRGKAEFLLCP